MSLPVKSHPNPLNSSRTLVIGGTSGIGAAVVSAALANGGSVHVSSSNAERIAAKIAEFKALYPETSISGTAADLSDETTLEDNIKRVLDEAVQALGGPIDHLVYTAGDGYNRKPLSDVDAKTYFKGWNVRYLGPLMFVKTIKGSPGTYLNVDASSSITLTSGGLAHKPVAGVSHFIGWAGAIEATGRGLAVDLAPIRVNVISPGAIYTEMLASLPEAMISSFGEKSLMKRVGSASDAAEAYLFSMRSAFVSGEVIKVDGGILFT